MVTVETRLGVGGRAGGLLILSEADAARLLSLSPRSLQRLRIEGDGPAFIRLGARRIGYRPEDLAAWIAGRGVASTSATTEGPRGRRA